MIPAYLAALPATARALARPVRVAARPEPLRTEPGDHVHPASTWHNKSWDANSGSHKPRCPDCLCLLSPAGECALCEGDDE